MIESHNIFRKITGNVMSYIKDRHNSDEGADVLVVALIVFPAIIAAVGLALDVTKNVYLDATYENMAQQAAYSASQDRNIRGELTSSSGSTFVREYMRQRGDDTDHIGANSNIQTAETAAYRPERCQSTTADNIDDIEGNAEIVFPYIRLDYGANRAQGGNFAATQFISQGGNNPSMTDYSPAGSYVVTAQVYDVSSNFFLGMLGQECQVYNAQVSSMAVQEDADFRG